MADKTAAYAGIAMCALVMLGGGGAAVATRQKMAGGGAAFIGLVSVIMLSLYVAGYLGGSPKRDRAIKEATAEGGEFKEWMVPVYDELNSEDNKYAPEGEDKILLDQFMAMGKLFEIAQCKYSDWGEWDNDCSDATKSERTRTRTIGDGADAEKCMDLTETEMCGAKDCMMSDWSECVDGKRTRTVVSPAMFGGKACGAMEEVGPCAIATAPVDSSTPTVPTDASSAAEPLIQAADTVTEQAMSAATTASSVVAPAVEPVAKPMPESAPVAPAVQPTAEAVTEYIMKKDLDLRGGTLKMLRDTKSANECAEACKDNVKCALFVRNPKNGYCWLKNDAALKKPRARIMTGSRNAYIKPSDSVPSGVYASMGKGMCDGGHIYASKAGEIFTDVEKNAGVREVNFGSTSYRALIKRAQEECDKDDDCAYVSVFRDGGYRTHAANACDTHNAYDNYTKSFRRVKLE